MEERDNHLNQVGWITLGLLFGPALGMLLSLIFSFDLALGLVYGAGLGIVVASVIELLRRQRVD